MNSDQGHQQEWYRGVPISAKWPIIIGLGALLVCGGGFGTWAAMAPLKSAVVAAGRFVATGQNKLVQHLEGGIIREILAKEGDLIEGGQVVIRMDETSSRVKLRRLVLRKLRLLAMQSRLQAEVRGEPAMEMPAELVAVAGDSEVQAIFAQQRSELQARRAALAAEEQVLRKEIAAIEESLHGYEAQVTATKQRLAIFKEELQVKTKLLSNNLIRKTDVLSVQRAEADLSGDLGELVSRMADANERSARANQRIVHLKALAVKTAVQELREAETEFDDVLEQIHAVQDVVNRTEVRAPERGIVVKVNYHTAGAVVAPGAVIMELLPVGGELIIEAHVKPSDVAHVTVDQQALVRLTALNQRVTPTIAGKVIYLSADALTEQAPAIGNNGGSVRKDYYVARVRLDKSDVHARLAGFAPTPGMPADVYIQTGERTFFEYIMRPVMDTFSRAFRET
jgi:HlyD family type I secretion membrane fusion protein